MRIEGVAQSINGATPNVKEAGNPGISAQLTYQLVHSRQLKFRRPSGPDCFWSSTH